MQTSAARQSISTASRILCEHVLTILPSASSSFERTIKRALQFESEIFLEIEIKTELNDHFEIETKHCNEWNEQFLNAQQCLISRWSANWFHSSRHGELYFVWCSSKQSFEFGQHRSWTFSSRLQLPEQTKYHSRVRLRIESGESDESHQTNLRRANFAKPWFGRQHSVICHLWRMHFILGLISYSIAIWLSR